MEAEPLRVCAAFVQIRLASRTLAAATFQGCPQRRFCGFVEEQSSYFATFPEKRLELKRFCTEGA
jgi:hypothetical protein